LLLADERLGEAYAEAEIVSALGTSLRTIERPGRRRKRAFILPIPFSI